VDKRIKALAVTTARRAVPPLDGIPTIAETIPGSMPPAGRASPHRRARRSRSWPR